MMAILWSTNRSVAVAAFLLNVLFVQAVHAQNPSAWDPVRTQADRPALQQLLVKLEQTANSNAYSSALRARASREAALLRNRLVEGDFQVGDRLNIKVEGQTELTSTFTVAPGPSLLLPGIRELSLAGVLRAEIRGHLAQHLAQFLVKPVIDVEPLMRIWVAGAVNRPGFYTVAAETPLTDALMTAGGPTPQAKLTEIRIERDGRRIWEGEALQQAMNEGRTLDQLSLRAGDRIILDASRSRVLQILQTAAWVIPPLLYLISQFRD